MKKILLGGILLLSAVSIAQREVSVVEVFCNTADYDARFVIPDFAEKASVADTNDLNHVYIQHHVAGTFPGWTDQFTTNFSQNKYNQYLGWNSLDSLSAVVVNGISSQATSWYDCSPVEKEIYSNGAKKVTLLFEDYNASNSQVSVRFVLAKKYTVSEQKKISVYMLQSGMNVAVSGGANSGQNFVLNNVAVGQRVKDAIVYTDTVNFVLPTGVNPDNIQFVAYVQDEANGEILGGTRGFKLKPYLTAPGSEFAVVEMFCNTGCFGGPSAISSMENYAALAETNVENEALIQLHIYQPYGNWSDIYRLALNDERYDKYSWEMGILAGLAAVSKNGIRYTPDSWNSCKPLSKRSVSFIDMELASYSNHQLTVDYTLSGTLNPHDRVYFYVVESGITVEVTGGEIPGTILNMNNVARVGRWKETDVLTDTVVLEIPESVNLQNARLVAYIQNDVTYEVTGGSKGMELDDAAMANVKLAEEQVDFSIYPNPSKDAFSLLLNRLSGEKEIRVSIIDQQGRNCFKKDLPIVPSVLYLSDIGLQTGIYLVKIENENLQLIQKIEINK